MSSSTNTLPLVKGGRVWYSALHKPRTLFSKIIILIINLISTLAVFALPILICIALMPKLINQSTTEYYSVTPQVQINDWRFLIAGILLLIFSAVVPPTVFFYQNYNHYLTSRWKLRLFLGIKIFFRFIVYGAATLFVFLTFTSMGFATNVNQDTLSDWLTKTKDLESINVTQLNAPITYMKKDGQLVEVTFSYPGADKIGVKSITKPDLSSAKK